MKQSIVTPPAKSVKKAPAGLLGGRALARSPMISRHADRASRLSSFDESVAMILWSLPMTKVTRSMKSWSIAEPRTSARAGLYGGRLQIVGSGDLVGCIGGHRKLSGAIVRVRRERIEPLDAVGRYANDGGAGGIEFVFLFRKCVRFEIAALGVGGRDRNRPRPAPFSARLAGKN